MQCEQCQGECWDNTKGKYWGTGIDDKTGKPKPRWACKNKDGCGWKGGYATPATAAPGSPSGAPKGAVPTTDRLKDAEAVYDACFAAAIRIAEKYAEQYPTAIAGRLDIPAMASTMMIQAFR